jgi:hypothetical protein
MKQTLTTGQVADALRRDENARWSYEAAHALAEYYESIEACDGKEIELDVVAIRCEWTEYKTAHEIAEAYDIPVEGDEEDEEDVVTEYVNELSQLIKLPNGAGYLVQQF